MNENKEKLPPDKMVVELIIKCLDDNKIPTVSCLAALMATFSVIAAKLGMLPTDFNKFLEVSKVSYSQSCISIFKNSEKSS
jgi:hypothetical protein